MNCRICGGATHKVFDAHSQRQAIEIAVFRCRTCDAHCSNRSPINYDSVDLSSYYLSSADVIPVWDQ
jgi:transcriptional regulator NrdR family protein